uniref:Uncharacterized protein n=1 Tax=Ectopseudomonas mendocina TaxID=300 RepID=A0A514C886_ECTME|nr:hypothetical protein [Pseudomonas mendocina]
MGTSYKLKHVEAVMVLPRSMPRFASWPRGTSIMPRAGRNDECLAVVCGSSSCTLWITPSAPIQAASNGAGVFFIHTNRTAGVVQRNSMPRPGSGRPARPCACAASVVATGRSSVAPFWNDNRQSSL